MPLTPTRPHAALAYLAVHGGLSEAWGRARHALLAGAHDNGRPNGAKRYAGLLIRAAPLDEEAVREAMRPAVAMGDRHRVARRFEALAVRIANAQGATALARRAEAARQRHRPT